MLKDIIIIESVDSISRDGSDTPIILYVIHYKSLNKNSALINYQDFKLIHSSSLADSLSNKPTNTLM